MIAAQIGATMCVFAATGYFLASTVEDAICTTTSFTRTLGLSSVALGLVGIVTGALGFIWM